MRDAREIEARLGELDALIGELGAHYAEDIGRIEIFSYSGSLCDEMNGRGLYDPQAAYDLFCEIRDGYLDELAALTAR